MVAEIRDLVAALAQTRARCWRRLGLEPEDVVNACWARVLEARSAGASLETNGAPDHERLFAFVEAAVNEQARARRHERAWPEAYEAVDEGSPPLEEAPARSGAVSPSEATALGLATLRALATPRQVELLDMLPSLGFNISAIARELDRHESTVRERLRRLRRRAKGEAGETCVRIAMPVAPPGFFTGRHAHSRGLYRSARSDTPRTRLAENLGVRKSVVLDRLRRLRMAIKRALARTPPRTGVHR